MAKISAVGPVSTILPVGHDADPVRNLADDAEIMGDEQHRHAVIILERLQQREDLRLHRYVECCGRLVGDQELRPVGKRHGDHHTLALAARQFMRIGGKALFRLADADLIEQLQHPGTGSRTGDTLMQIENFGDLPLDRMQRIERRHRLLEDHRDVVAAHPAQVRIGRRHQVLAIEEDLPARMAGRRIRQELEDGIGRD